MLELVEVPSGVEDELAPGLELVGGVEVGMACGFDLDEVVGFLGGAVEEQGVLQKRITKVNFTAVSDLDPPTLTTSWVTYPSHPFVLTSNHSLAYTLIITSRVLITCSSLF